MKKLFFFFTIILAGFASKAQNEFITRWDLSKLGSSPTALSFGVITSGTVNYFWEEVSPGAATGSGSFSGSSCTVTGLPANAVIRLKINPTNFQRVILYTSVDRDRIVDVQQWGAVNWISMENAFRDCKNLNITSTDIPNLNSVSSMKAMLRGCNVLNGPSNINNWNTSNVTDMTMLFTNDFVFNQPLNNWNTSNVTSMAEMFRYAYAFNQPLNNWNTSNVTNMYYMFFSDYAFNQPIGNWNTINVTNMSGMFAHVNTFNQPIGNWNTSSVTNMNAMFGYASSFNQPIGNWNVSNITDMSDMFTNASSFNYPLGNWVLNSNVNLANTLNYCGMDCYNYSSTLIGWANNPNTPNNLNLYAYGLYFDNIASAARDVLTSSKAWVIQGDQLSSTGCQTNSINGIVRFDNTNNGCDPFDPMFPYLRFNVSGSSTQSSYSNDGGSYSIPVLTGVFNITPQLIHPTYFNVSPATFTANFSGPNNTLTQPICVTANGIHNDLQVSIVPIIPAVPGFDATYKLIIYNLGTTSQSGTVDFSYDATKCSVVNSSISPSSNTSGNLTFPFTNLNPITNVSIDITMNVLAPPVVNIGDILTPSLVVSASAIDENQLDNSFTLQQTVVASYDPNDKVCLQGYTISPTQVGGYLDYVIHFENTGNYPATNIVVRDLIDLSKFDISTLQVTSSSHAVNTNIVLGNMVEFYFNGINLPFSSGTNSGYVAFKIKTLNTLTVGTQIANQAKIYFDFNAPIVTNNEVTIVDIPGAFTTKWDLSKPGSSPTAISFGVVTNGTVNYTWEEISPGTATGSGTFSGSTCTISGLPSNSIIRLKIEPNNFQRIKSNIGGNQQRLLDVEKWGNVTWTSMAGAFKDCNHLNISSSDIPNLNSVTDMSEMFMSCSTNGPVNINNWNTINVTNMSRLFAFASNFNQSIGNWNTSNVTNMSDMFALTYFNQNIDNWNTSNVVYMGGMFYYAISFNQNLSSWNTSNVIDMTQMFEQATSFNQNIGNWNTGSVVSMYAMFKNATSFNQNIGSWNTSNVITMNSMFLNATSFNQNLGYWSLKPTINIQDMLNNSNLNCENYSATLKGWTMNNPNVINKNFGAVGRMYGTDVVTFRNILVTSRNWIITGDILGSGSCLPPEIFASACNSYTWVLNNQTYTNSGTYYYGTNQLNLTIFTNCCPTNWNDISMYGGNSVRGVKDDGTLWSINPSGVAIQIGTDNHWWKVSQGNNHTLALKNDGSLWVWGTNNQGQLGTGNQTNIATPFNLLPGTTWKFIYAGQFYSFGIKTNGTLWAWGLNDYGNLGVGNSNYSQYLSPTQVGTANNWKSLNAEMFSVLALRTDGTIWSWGENSFSCLGTSSSNAIVPSPLQVGTANNWVEIAKGNNFSLGIKANGAIRTLWSWGLNSQGQLGNSNTTTNITPTQIGTATNWITIAAGTCSHAINSNNEFYRWGANVLSPTQIQNAQSWKLSNCKLNAQTALDINGTFYYYANGTFNPVYNACGPTGPTSNTSSVNACVMYLWSVNNQTYSQNGNYTYTSVNTSGYAHNEILNLTINPSPNITSITPNPACINNPVTVTTYGASQLQWFYNGNTVYSNSTLPTGNSTGITIAGGNGAGSSANQLNYPLDVVFNAQGGMYVSDPSNHRVQYFANGSSIGVTVAGGNGYGTALNQVSPQSIWLTANGDLYVADVNKHRILKFPPNSTSATNGMLIAGGNGAGSGANQFNEPYGVCVDNVGNVYVADRLNHRIQKWSPGATAGVTIMGGGGQGNGINQLNFPLCITLDANNNIYVSEGGNHQIRKLNASTNQITVYAGGNGVGTALNQLNTPTGICFDASGNLYVSDMYNYRVQKFPPNSSSITNAVNVAGGYGQGIAANQFYRPYGVAINLDGDVVAVDIDNNRVQKWLQSQVTDYTPTQVGTYTIVATGANGCSSSQSEVVLTCNPLVDLKLFIQGYYLNANLMQSVLMNQGVGSNNLVADNVVIELRNAMPPYSIVGSANSILNTNGTVQVNFTSVLPGNYYIVIKHRNAIETWSANPVSITTSGTYDFSLAASNAFGNNQTEVEPGVFALYSGDINQDGAMDAFDYLVLDPDIIAGNSGYFNTDLNGDGSVDAFDYLLLDPNIIAGVGVMKP